MASLAALVACSGPPAPPTQEDVGFGSFRELFLQARQAVEASTGVSLEHVELEIVPPEAMPEVLLGEGFWADDAGYDPSIASAHRQTIARTVLGLYSWKRGAIVVARDAMPAIAKFYEISDQDVDGVWSSLFLHELVHAADAISFEIMERMPSLRPVDEVRAYCAIVEGHAQFIARRLARELGIERQFEILTRIVGGEDDDAAKHLSQSALVSTTYLDGEEFIERLHSIGGRDAVRDAFLRPPRHLAEIDAPEAFLQGRSVIDRLGMEGACRHMRSLLSEDQWVISERSMSLREFSSTLSPLTREETEHVAKTRLQSHQFRAVRRSGPLSGEVLLQLFEFDTPEAAGSYIEAYGRVRRLRDQQFASGEVRLEDQAYRSLSTGDESGLIFEKRALFGSEEVRIKGVCIARGRAVVELVLRNMTDWSEAAALSAAREMLERLQDAH